MRGLWIQDGALRFREDLEPPEPTREGAVLVDVTLAGICATDLALRAGYMGFVGVPGHEFTGIARSGRHAGRRVVGEINAGCGSCALCKGGDPRHCHRRTVLGILRHPGAFAESVWLPEENLHAIPDGVPDEVAVFTEPVAAAFEILEQTDLARHERRLVLGDGKLGLLCAQVLTSDGGSVDVRGRHPERGAALGPRVRHLGPLPEARPVPEDRYDLVVEATGDPAVFARALAATRPRGTLVLKTTSEVAPPTDLAPLVVDEITLVGSRCGPFDRALEALESGIVRVRPFIEARMPIEHGAEAFELAARPGVMKVLLDPVPRAEGGL